MPNHECCEELKPISNYVKRNVKIKCFMLSSFCFEQKNGVLERKYHVECITHFFGMK